MPYWLATERTVQREDVLTRFDPRFWTVDFPRPMTAAATNPAHDAVRVDLAFYRRNDLAGLIWEAEDGHDHPLLAYETSRDFRGCRLRFRWRSGGVMPLDAVNGPTLTIEGRDEAGRPRAWYVRLWNYAQGSPEDAAVALDFAALEGGFRLPDEADPVWAGDVDRMFVSMVAAGYTGEDAALAEPVEGWVELTGMACEGPGSVLAIGDVGLPPHGAGIATAYDDGYHLTPARLLRQALHLGYRGAVNHYVGMSHYFRLGADEEVSLAGGALNGPCAAWHRDFAGRCAELGYEVIWSLSFELFDRHCPEGWKQRAADGSPALTGWEPPSTLLSPTNGEAMAYLRAVARAFVRIGVEAGLSPKFQVGEPWWWVKADGRPCIYDAAAVAAFAPMAVPSVRGALDVGQRATLDRAGASLAAATAGIVAAARDEAPGCEALLLAYLPGALDPSAPEVRRMNLPVGWAAPAFDVLQLEDYEWVTSGDVARSAEGAMLAGARLGYPPGKQHYLSGFVLRPEDKMQWGRIDAALETARARGVRQAFVWALPQVARDGFTRFGGEAEVQAFDDVAFPLALGREVEVAPGFSTAVLTAASGRETRNSMWAEARTTYDVGPGVRSEADIAALLAFFRARMGPARGFRLRDPFDSDGRDESLGTGDGAARRFALVRRYGDSVRRITRPVAGSISVAVDGAATPRFAVEPGGWVVLDEAPAEGAAVTASFAFDVPVRFAEDRLAVSRATFLAGEAASVPLVEIRED